MILADDWACHRHPVTGERLGNKDDWTEWDYALVAAYETIEAHTDQHGNFRWETEDEAVFINAVRRIDKFEEAKDQITGAKGYKPTPGEYFVPDLQTRRSSGHIQTFTEYLEAQVAAAQSEVEES